MIIGGGYIGLGAGKAIQVNRRMDTEVADIWAAGDRSTGRLLGVQLVGHRASEVSKRVDIVATALYHGMAVKELCDLDLSYTPPLSSPWDPVQMAAMEWCSKR